MSHPATPGASLLLYCDRVVARPPGAGGVGERAASDVAIGFDSHRIRHWVCDPQVSAASPRLEIWFESLFNEGRGLVFPCNERGHVDIDALSERTRSNYFFARAMLGRENATPG